ncbi:MAG: hypothetical protein JXA11_17085 [Phycisphaerae bacterium]|nr:hypothetical protein [Phycisphaerae bacterium]
MTKRLHNPAIQQRINTLSRRGCQRTFPQEMRGIPSEKAVDTFRAQLQPFQDPTNTPDKKYCEKKVPHKKQQVTHDLLLIAAYLPLFSIVI